MRIIVPTRGRIGRQATIEHMSPRLRDLVTVVCPQQEIQKHRLYSWMMDLQYVSQPDPNMTIAAKRRWILENWRSFSADGRLIMMDDDLRMYIRREDRPDRLRYAEDEDQEIWLHALADRLSPEVPHAGLGPRQGNDKMPDGWIRGARMMLILAYHAPTVVAECELGRIETREDFDYTLQLLRKGLPNEVTHHFVVGQKGYNEPGGASSERTLESSNADAERLAELHPGYVRLVQKDYQNYPRTEVVIQWKRALADGLKWRQDRSRGAEEGGGS